MNLLDGNTVLGFTWFRYGVGSKKCLSPILSTIVLRAYVILRL